MSELLYLVWFLSIENAWVKNLKVKLQLFRSSWLNSLLLIGNRVLEVKENKLCGTLQHSYKCFEKEEISYTSGISCHANFSLIFVYCSNEA